MSTITQKLVKFVTVTVIGAAALTLPACQTNAGTGALVGGAAGAGLGALITHHAGGAVVGGAAGAITGALIGNSIDREEDRHDREVVEGRPYYWRGNAWYFVGYDAYHQPIYEHRLGYDGWGRPVVERRVFANAYPYPRRRLRGMPRRPARHRHRRTYRRQLRCSLMRRRLRPPRRSLLPLRLPPARSRRIANSAYEVGLHSPSKVAAGRPGDILLPNAFSKGGKPVCRHNHPL